MRQSSVKTWARSMRPNCDILLSTKGSRKYPILFAGSPGCKLAGTFKLALRGSQLTAGCDRGGAKQGPLLPPTSALEHATMARSLSGPEWSHLVASGSILPELASLVSYRSLAFSVPNHPSQRGFSNPSTITPLPKRTKSPRPTCLSKLSTVLWPFERRWKHQSKGKSNHAA
jgi:hypothetical protein